MKIDRLIGILSILLQEKKTRTFQPETKGAELVPELKVVTDNVFEKSRASALTSEAFAKFVEKNGIVEFYITGADATGCVKSTDEAPWAQYTETDRATMIYGNDNSAKIVSILLLI